MQLRLAGPLKGWDHGQKGQGCEKKGSKGGKEGWSVQQGTSQVGASLMECSPSQKSSHTPFSAQNSDMMLLENM